MKRLKLKINKNLKKVILGLAIVGGMYAYGHKSDATKAVQTAFVFSLVTGMKAKGAKLDEGEESLLKELETEMSLQLEAWLKAKDSILTKETFDTFLSEKSATILGALAIKDAKIGEQTIEAILKAQGGDISKLLEAIEKGQSAEKKTFKDLLTDKMGEIETIFKNKSGHITLELKAPAIMTTANTIDETTNTLPEDLVESMTMAAFAGKRYGAQFIGDVADRTTVADMEKYTTWLEEGSEQGAFAIVAEGAVKPLVSMDLVRNVAEAQKVAGKYVVTEEFAKFYKNAYTIIRRLINDKMLRDYNAILTSDLNGAAAGYAGTTLDGTITAPNDYDAIGAIAAQIETLHFIPDVIILNPQDKWRIRLTKDANGRYQFPVTTENGETRIFEFRIVTSTYQTPGWVTLGESGLYKIEEEPISVRIGYGINTTSGGGNVTSVDSDFDTNRFRVILETWFKNYLPTPYNGSFVRAQFSTVKTALLAAQA